jgi:hypothetical protein
MTTLQQINGYDFYANLYPIIREPGWEVGHMSYGSIRFRRECPFDVSDDYRQRTWAIGIATYPNSWHYCWQARQNGAGISARLYIPLDSSPEFAYEAAHARAAEWFGSKAKQVMARYLACRDKMKPGE